MRSGPAICDSKHSLGSLTLVLELVVQACSSVGSAPAPLSPIRIPPPDSLRLTIPPAETSMVAPQPSPPAGPPLPVTVSVQDRIELYRRALRAVEQDGFPELAPGQLLVLGDSSVSPAVWRALVSSGVAAGICVPSPRLRDACAKDARGEVARIRSDSGVVGALSVWVTVGPMRGARDNTWLVATTELTADYVFVHLADGWRLMLSSPVHRRVRP